MVAPMLARPAHRGLLASDLQGSHAFDLKLDGVRALISVEAGVTTIRSRTGQDLTRQFPELNGLAFEGVLDGEIIANSNSFEVTNTRAKQQSGAAIRKGMILHPCQFVAFDVLRVGTTDDLVAQPWLTRRQRLDSLAIDEHPSHSRTVFSTDASFLTDIASRGLEGVVAKRLSSTYQQGKRSPDWLKFKNLHRVTCLALGYATGTGSRAAFGAVHLALIDGAEFVNVGRVGSGFSEKSIATIKASLDAGKVTIVEVQCLGVTSTGQLRQPVLKGIRSDANPLTDCALAQLDTIPRS